MEIKKVKILSFTQPVLLLILGIVAGVVFAIWEGKLNFTGNSNNKNNEARQEEAVLIDRQDFPSGSITLDFESLKKYFQKLAKEKTARYAYAVLKASPLGPNIDLHLLGHAVGDELYKQEGIGGITVCDNDFRNACSHSIVIGLFYDKGDAALGEIAQACRKAPGGSGAYTMCFHGLGHGILAYEGYDMEKAAAMCEKTGTAQYGYQESTQCLSGTVMEIVGGGGHDKQIWESQRPKYLDPKNPTSLCEQDYFPPRSKFLCYEYISPYLFEAVGASLGSPTAEDFKKAFLFCDAVPQASRHNCFSGFGKEFVGIVQSRDIRMDALARISESSLKQVYEWCMLTPNKPGQAACVVDAMNNLYWGGENDPAIALRFCGQVLDQGNEKPCYYGLMSSVSYYIKDANYRADFCGKVPDEYKDECKQRLN